MDQSFSETRNILMELESLKSKECIFKMKEENYIKDKEILEDSIKTLQTDLQEKSEIIRTLRKDLDSQSSSIFRDIVAKDEELEKSLLDINDLTKKLNIALETVDYHVKRNETIKSEFEKQKKIYDRELECKTRMITFLETSNSQKEGKVSVLTSDIIGLKESLSVIQLQFEQQKKINEDLRSNLEEIKSTFDEESNKREQDLNRAKNEIIQLQQNGISELHLEKMNPTVAATIKALKSSKGLMDIYSELHGVIGERDFLQLEKDRLIKNKEELETILKYKETEIHRFTSESKESNQVMDNLKSRLLGLVAELRSSEAMKGKMEREMLLAKRKSEISEKEVLRLMEQVRVLMVGSEIGENIKQEPVDVDSAMYTSVQELQEVNRALRNDNEVLRQHLEETDSEQFKQRCNELQVYSDSLSSEVELLRHESTSNRSLLVIHEKQVQMLRYLLELKNPISAAAIDKALKSLEDGIKCSVELSGDSDIVEEEISMDNELKTDNESDRIAKLENDLLEFMDNKRASDHIYITSLESMRTDFLNKNRLAIELNEKLEDLNEKLKEERELNERYRNESELLRAINKNLSHNSSILESQTEEIKLKMECKISELAEKKADLDSCKSQLALCRSQQTRLRQERDELKKSMDRQKEILTNISSLQNVTNLKDHLCLSNMQHRVQELELLVEQLNEEVNIRSNELSRVYKELNASKADLNESISQLNESRALADAFNVSISIPEMSDADCQVELLVVTEPKQEELVEQETPNPTLEIMVTEYKKTISDLEEQLRDTKTELQTNNDRLTMYAREMVESNQKCEFYESQLDILEKAKQEVLNENIKLTEEAHDLNSSLKQDLHKYQEELQKLKIRLEEAETVERTAQSVIDKYVKECNEAKAKYKRELTLHAADSKLLESLNGEIEILKAREDDGDIRCKQLRQELLTTNEKWQRQLENIRIEMTAVEQKLREAEERNDRLYQQLNQASNNNESNLLKEVIEDLRSQISMGKLTDNLLEVEKEKYYDELERLQSEISDLHEQLSMEKDKSNLSISESELSSRNIETEIVIESNQVLREQKSQLDRVVLGQRTQIGDLTQLVAQLRADIGLMEANNSSLSTVKCELEEERNRWKERCTKLIERAEQLDPEKYRAACNDRDRLEKQLCERENNLKEVQCELNKAKEEIGKLLISIEEEKNKLKKEEVIGLQLKEIARKYKNEAEKKRLSISELEETIVKMNIDAAELMKEKETMTLQLETMATELNSRTLELADEREKLTSKIEIMELDFDVRLKILTTEKETSVSDLDCRVKTLVDEKQELTNRIEVLIKEKEDSMNKLSTVEAELDVNGKLVDELTCRCQLLEQDCKEKSMKLQLIESTMVRLKDENKQLRSGNIEDKCATKRIIDDSVDESEGPESKRQKMASEESTQDDSDEDEEEEDQSSVVSDHADVSYQVDQNVEQNTTTGAINQILNATTTLSGSKIWWNVADDGDVSGQLVVQSEDAEMEDEECGEVINEGDMIQIEENVNVGNVDNQSYQGENLSYQGENLSISEGYNDFENASQCYEEEQNKQIQDIKEGSGCEDESHGEDGVECYDVAEEESDYYRERMQRSANMCNEEGEIHDDEGSYEEDYGCGYSLVGDEDNYQCTEEGGQEEEHEQHEYYDEEKVNCSRNDGTNSQCSGYGGHMEEESHEDEEEEERVEDKQVNMSGYMMSESSHAGDNDNDNEEDNDSDSSVVIIDDSSDDNNKSSLSLITEVKKEPPMDSMPQESLAQGTTAQDIEANLAAIRNEVANRGRVRKLNRRGAH